MDNRLTDWQQQASTSKKGRLILTTIITIFQSPADRVLIYLTLYISECLKKLQKVKLELLIINIFGIFFEMNKCMQILQ